MPGGLLVILALVSISSTTMGSIDCRLQSRKDCNGRCNHYTGKCFWDSNVNSCVCKDTCTMADTPSSCVILEHCFWDISSNRCERGGKQQPKECMYYQLNHFVKFSQEYPNEEVRCPEDPQSYCTWQPLSQSPKCIGSCMLQSTPMGCAHQSCPEDPSRSCFWKAKDGAIGRCLCSNDEESCANHEEVVACENSYCPNTAPWINKVTSKCRWNHQLKKCECYLGELAPTTCHGIELLGTCSTSSHPTVAHYCESGCGIAADGRCSCTGDVDVPNIALDNVLVGKNAHVTKIVSTLSHLGILFIIDANAGIATFTSNPGTISLLNLATISVVPFINSLTVDVPTSTMFICGYSSIYVFDAVQDHTTLRSLGVLMPNLIVRSLLDVVVTRSGSRWLVAVSDDGLIVLSVGTPSYFNVTLHDMSNEVPLWSFVVPHPILDKLCFAYSSLLTTKVMLISLNGEHDLVKEYECSTVRGILSPDCGTVIIEHSEAVSLLNLTDPSSDVTPTETDFPPNSSIGGAVGDDHFSLIVNETVVVVANIKTLDIVFTVQQGAGINSIDYNILNNCLLVAYNDNLVASYILPIQRQTTTPTPIPSPDVVILVPTGEPVTFPPSTVESAPVVVIVVVILAIGFILCVVVLNRDRVSQRFTRSAFAGDSHREMQPVL